MVKVANDALSGAWIAATSSKSDRKLSPAAGEPDSAPCKLLRSVLTSFCRCWSTSLAEQQPLDPYPPALSGAARSSQLALHHQWHANSNRAVHHLRCSLQDVL